MSNLPENRGATDPLTAIFVFLLSLLVYNAMRDSQPYPYKYPYKETPWTSLRNPPMIDDIKTEPVKSKVKKREPFTVNIKSFPPGARIYLDGEYIGNAPLKKTINGDFMENGFYVVAEPIGDGCKQFEWILSSRPEPPKEMFFDTQWCPIQKSIDVNVSNDER